MPYKREGKKILKKEGGKWKVKQTAKSVENAKKALSLLRGVEHGWKPSGKKKRNPHNSDGKIANELPNYYRYLNDK